MNLFLVFGIIQFIEQEIYNPAAALTEVNGFGDLDINQAVLGVVEKLLEKDPSALAVKIAKANIPNLSQHIHIGMLREARSKEFITKLREQNYKMIFLFKNPEGKKAV